ncbi:MAG: tetratricopeptide repeat protein [Candidatus Eremiobacteraeota bacterium]|nr:tetratricopeptide repeat protein [Candidatus Eremiobacteraeota bacterium]
MKNLPVRLLFAAMAFFLAPCAAHAQTAVLNPVDLPTGFESNSAQAMEQARARVAAGDFTGAVRELSIYVAAHPKERAPARLLGDLYYRQGDLATAERVYRAIILNVADDRETHNRLGAVYATQNRIDDAIAEYTKSLPGTDSIADLVALHQRKGDLAAYRKSVERDAESMPSISSLQGDLGAVYLAEHEYSRALLYFLKELDLSPNSILGLNHAAIAYMDLGAYDKAFDLLNRCRAKYQYEYSCTLNLAAADLETRQFEKGKALLDRAEQLEPEHPEINVNYGYLADAQGNWKQAVSYYVKALQISPYTRDAYLDLGVDYEQHHLYDLAESALLKGLSVVPTDGALHYLLGRTYQDQKKHDLAVEQFQAAFRSNDPAVATLAKVRISQLGGSAPQLR